MDQSKIKNLNPQEYTHLPHAEQHFEAHEQTDVAIGPLVATLIAIALTVIVSAVGLWGMFELLEYLARNDAGNQNLSKVEPSVRKVPDGYPDLQGIPAADTNANSPAQDMVKFREHNDRVLAGEKPMREGLKASGKSIEQVMDEALAGGMFKTAAGPATRPSASGRE
jgi:hypothetical protein